MKFKKTVSTIALAGVLGAGGAMSTLPVIGSTTVSQAATTASNKANLQRNMVSAANKQYQAFKTYRSYEAQASYWNGKASIYFAQYQRYSNRGTASARKSAVIAKKNAMSSAARAAKYSKTAHTYRARAIAYGNQFYKYRASYIKYYGNDAFVNRLENTVNAHFGA